MKVPNIFIPEKVLENKIKQFLENQTSQETPQEYKNNLKNLDIQLARDQYLHFFQQSLELVQASGYERHMYPWENFSFIIKHFEQKTKKYSKMMVNEILSCGEWFSMAAERKKDKLICYLDPENIMWDNTKGSYAIDLVLQYREKKELDIGDLPSRQWIDLSLFNDRFVQYFYTRKFKDLPEQMKKGNYKAQVLLQEDDVLWPIGRDNKRVTSISCSILATASRGVHLKTNL